MATRCCGRCQQLPADVMLLDVSMPGPGLVPLLQELRTAHPTLPVLVLSVHPEDQYAMRALRAGARGYLTKDHSPEELVAAVRKVYRGGRYVSATLAERLAAEFDAAGSSRAPHEDLSDREFEVLCLVGSGRSVTEVAATLGLSVKTVSTYRTRLLQKMAATSNADLVRYVATHGSCANHPPDQVPADWAGSVRRYTQSACSSSSEKFLNCFHGMKVSIARPSGRSPVRSARTKSSSVQ